MVIPLVLALGVSAPVIGRLIDKFGTRIVMISGTMILVVGLILLSFFANNFYLFILSGIIIGLGMGTVIGSPLRYIMLSETPPPQRAAGQALINFNASAGQLVGGTLIGAVIASQGGKIAGYESAYIIIGGIAIIMFLLTFGLKKRTQQLAAIKNNAKSS